MIDISMLNGTMKLSYNLDEDLIQMVIDTDEVQLTAELDLDQCRRIAAMLTRLADYAEEAGNAQARGDRLVKMLKDAGIEDPYSVIDIEELNKEDKNGKI